MLLILIFTECRQLIHYFQLSYRVQNLSLISYSFDGKFHPDLFCFRTIKFYANVVSFVYFQDAKEHLAALANQLGPSLPDIDVRLSIFTSFVFFI